MKRKNSNSFSPKRSPKSS